MSELLIVGEALMDVVGRRDEGHGAGFDEHPGGSPANVALGLARLGHPARLVTRLGDDPRGLRIRSHLEASGVRLAAGSVVPGPTSTATAVLDAAGVATYDFAIDWDLPTDVPAGDARALHTGSIAAFLPPGGDAVLALVERLRPQLTISYDPNARPRLMGDPATAARRVERFVALSDVVKVSDEDLGWLAPGETPEEAAARWLATGPALVVVTLGAAGSLAVTARGVLRRPAPRVDVVDTVGAGDSFTAAMLDHLARADLLGADRRAALADAPDDVLTAMLDHAARVAAITCSRPGADPPTRAALAAPATP